jgi:subtilisin family serine protease
MVVGLLVGGLALTAGPAPARAAEQTGPEQTGPEQTGPAQTGPVSLVVGLRTRSDVVATLERQTGVDVVGSEPMAGAVTVEVPADQAGEAADALRADPAVSYVEPDHLAHMTTVTPNDPSYAGQWGIAKTRVNTAWGSTVGSPTVTVAVLDTGVAALPDLAGRLLPGKDFVNNDSAADDDNGHGTMTAGVIAAGGANGVGIAGICWACRILPVKVLGSAGSGTYSNIAAGIRYAADAGADIINMSLGGSADGQVLRDAVAYAVGKGALVISAAGNDGSSAPHYPAAIPSVLAVGGSTAADGRYSWSNWGPSWVDLAAPGCNPAQGINGVVGQFCGTSSATPFTSGVAALLASTSPQPTAAAIRIALMSTASKLAGNWVATGSGRVDAAAALTALAASDDHAPPVTSFRILPSALSSTPVHGIVTVGARASDDVGVSVVQLFAGSRLVASDTTSPYLFRWQTAPSTGAVTLTLRAYDRAGKLAIARTVVTTDNTAPSVTVTKAPASGTRHVPATAYVSVAAADHYGVRLLELMVNGKVTQVYAGRSYRFSVQTGKYGRSMTVGVRGYDTAGNVRYTPVRTWYR